MNQTGGQSDGRLSKAVHKPSTVYLFLFAGHPWCVCLAVSGSVALFLFLVSYFHVAAIVAYLPQSITQSL